MQKAILDNQLPISLALLGIVTGYSILSETVKISGDNLTFSSKENETFSKNISQLALEIKKHMSTVGGYQILSSSTRCLVIKKGKLLKEVINQESLAILEACEFAFTSKI